MAVVADDCAGDGTQGAASDGTLLRIGAGARAPGAQREKREGQEE